MEMNFVIQDAHNLHHMLELLDHCPSHLQVSTVKPVQIHYTSPSWGDANSVRQLTPKFKLGVEIFFVCRHVSIILWFQNRVCPYPEKRNHSSFVNISPTLVIDMSMERSSALLRVLPHRNPKIQFFFQKSLILIIELWLSFWLVPKSRNHLSFVHISPTLVIDASMERSSWVLQRETKKFEYFSKKF